MKSNTTISAGKPQKPKPDFPLFPHANGQWAKKIRGKLHYFGKWEDPDGALAQFEQDKADLYAGRVPRSREEHGPTIDRVVNKFLMFKEQLLGSGELSPRSYADYKRTCRAIKNHFGANRLATDLRPDDFAKYRDKLTKRLKLVAIGNEIQRVRSVFKFAYDSHLIDKPLTFGPAFRKPNRRHVRKARHEATRTNGKRMFSAEELRQLIEAADMYLKAQILLAINCGFGQSDIGGLPISAIDFESGWIDYPRPKTQVPRRVPLWPETLDALRDALAARKQHRDSADADIVFITSHGRRVAYATDTGAPVDNVGHMFNKLQDKAGTRRAGRSFYAIRHNVETIGGEAKDQVAVDAIMGHVDDSMAGHYREEVSDGRLQLVVNHIHDWLYPPDEK